MCVCVRVHSSAASMEGDLLSALCTPAFVVDVDKAKRNAQRMIERCQKLGVQLRPHMKTHKTLYGFIRSCIDMHTAHAYRLAAYTGF